MKKVIATAVLSLIFTFSTHASSDHSWEGFSWKELHDYALQCAVQPYAFQDDGKKVYSVLRSVCPELKVNGYTATLILNGQPLTAALTESPFADGGDLDDLTIRNQSGQIVAEAKNIPSFGDVILALAGGDDSFPLVFDESILLNRSSVAN